MKASLILEAIGDNTDAQVRLIEKRIDAHLGQEGAGRALTGWKRSYWCAEITGLHPTYNFERTFLTGKRDYARANSVGSRGIYVHFLLESGKVYEVLSPLTWKRSERYFCRVTEEEGEIERITEQEVREWLLQAQTSARSE